MGEKRRREQANAAVGGHNYAQVYQPDVPILTEGDREEFHSRENMVDAHRNDCSLLV